MMDLKNISDFQLFGIIQNEKMDPSIRALANEEFSGRNIAMENLQKIMARHDSLFSPPKENGLSFYLKVGLIICPFFIDIYNLIAGRSLAKGNKKKWKEYLVFVCAGYLFWTIIILLYAKFCFHQSQGRP